MSLGTAWAVVAVVDVVRFYRRRGARRGAALRPSSPQARAADARAASKARSQVVGARRSGSLVGVVAPPLGGAPSTGFQGARADAPSTGGGASPVPASWLAQPAVVLRRRVVGVLVSLVVLTAFGALVATSPFTLAVHLVADAALAGYVWLLARSAARRRALELRR